MSWTYNLGTDVGVVRLIVSDTQQATPIMQDEEYNAFLTLESGDIKLAAAQALDTIASNEALVQKTVKILDLQTDGARTANALRVHAVYLRQQVAQDQAAAEAGTDFDWAEIITGVAGERERIVDQALRGVL